MRRGGDDRSQYFPHSDIMGSTLYPQRLFGDSDHPLALLSDVFTSALAGALGVRQLGPFHATLSEWKRFTAVRF